MLSGKNFVKDAKQAVDSARGVERRFSSPEAERVVKAWGQAR
jgi:hypothetical protein